MSDDFTNKTVLVTGGNSGIGRGIAHRFAHAGAHVIIAARDPQKGAAVVAELGEKRAEFHGTDLSSETNVVHLLQKLEDRYGWELECLPARPPGAALSGSSPGREERGGVPRS